MSSAAITPMPSLRAPRLRITRRGRAVVAILLVAFLVVVGIFAGMNGQSAIANSSSAGQVFQTVTIQSGQSLWQIAQDYAPTQDPRYVVEEIMRLNQLSTAMLFPGQQVALPDFS